MAKQEATRPYPAWETSGTEQPGGYSPRGHKHRT